MQTRGLQAARAVTGRQAARAVARTLIVLCLACGLVSVVGLLRVARLRRGVSLASGWGVEGVQRLASHALHPSGWTLGKDQAEQDTGYLHMFAAGRHAQNSKSSMYAEQAHSDCLEHDCSKRGGHERWQKAEAQEEREEKEEEELIRRQARSMAKYAALGSKARHRPGLRRAPAHKPGAVLLVNQRRQKQKQALLAAKKSLKHIISPPSRNTEHMPSWIKRLDRIAPLPGLQTRSLRSWTNRAAWGGRKRSHQRSAWPPAADAV